MRAVIQMEATNDTMDFLHKTMDDAWRNNLRVVINLIPGKPEGVAINPDDPIRPYPKAKLAKPFNPIVRT